ncbi:MAG TPA: DNA methyltransferase, partial [Candidatus Paceibacterota bacterium]|nr:DNA methyltransferase [Candidatus Paceibacterota bacterium]
MDKESAKKLIKNTFQSSFDKEKFIYFIKNLLNQYDESKAFLPGDYNSSDPHNCINTYECIGSYTDPEGKKIDILIVYLQKETALQRARTAQRNFIARYLKSRDERDAGLIAFVSTQEADWRFSFVKMEYKFEKTPKGDIKVKEEFTPARRYSFLIGESEPSHTAQSQLLPLLEQEKALVFEQIEKAFSVDKVTSEFYQEYIVLFKNIKNILSKQNVDMGQIINLSNKEEKLDNFVHQILIRIMFMYFVQKRGCFSGDKNFLSNYWYEYQNKYCGQNKFHSDWLNILTFEALSKPFFAYNDKLYLSKFNETLRSAPYLNGGLFQKNDFDEVGWQINDTLFNDIFKFFEKYNFTVIESSPIDVEVALDPEMLGNVYEMIVNAMNSNKEGIFYTPKTEIYLMINKSLVEYLFQKSKIEKEKLYKFIFLEEKSQNIDELSLYEREAILREIEEIKILDPACGSGHYLVCALDILSNLKKYLYLQENKKYDLFEGKKKIIEVSIYGVDVIRWAAEIAKMRLWLDLFLEASEEQWTSTEPLLPSLSCKIRIGDSLVQSIGDKLIGLRTFKSSNVLSKELERLKKEKLLLYQNQSNYQDVMNVERNFLERYLTVRRIEIQQEIQRKNELINEYKSQHQEKLFGTKKEQQSFFEIKKLKLEEEKNNFLKQLKEIDEYASNIQNYIRENKEPPFIWDIAFAELFDDKEGKNGVDIIVANPPYIRQELIADPLKYFSKSKYKEKLSQQLKLDWNKYRESIIKIDKKSDLYIYFYLKSLQLLNSKGIMCFITSNSWLDVGYGKNLQEILLKR